MIEPGQIPQFTLHGGPLCRFESRFGLALGGIVWLVLIALALSEAGRREG